MKNTFPYKKKKMALIIGLFVFAAVVMITPFQPINSIGSEDPDSPEMKEWLDEPPEKEYVEPQGGWVYAHLKFIHDIKEPNLYHMKLLAHPESDVPDVIGAYAFTDVGVNILLRGVDAPRALHNAEELHRPHEWRRRERERWDQAMRYVWSVAEPTKTFRVHNLKKIDTATIEADVEFLLGGQWNDLAIFMVRDEFLRPIGDPPTFWDAGGREYGLLNPEVPK